MGIGLGITKHSATAPTVAIALGAAAVVGEVVLPRHGWGVPIAVIGALGAWLVLDAVRSHRPASALPWYLLTVSLVAPALGMALQHAMDRPAMDLPASSHGLLVVGMVASVASFALFVRARTRILDRYQLLDLAIFAVSAALAMSQLVLEPAMDVQPPVGISRGLSTAYMLIMLFTLVLVVRFVTLPGRRGRAVWYLLVVTATIVVGSLVANATATEDGGGWRISWTLTICTALTVAAARHESMRDLTEPAVGEPPSFGTLRLIGLAGALFITPLTAVLVHERTGEVSVVSLLIPAALITALVMARLRLLFSREAIARDELRHQASHDALTSLPNREFLSDEVDATLESGLTTSVLFIDLDDFKNVNDGLGHHAGDVLLEAVAGRLKNAARKKDTVARLGGDEFGVVVTADDQSAARDVAHRVLEVLEAPFDVLGNRVCIGASIGVASSNGGTVQDLLRQADVAMYRAKASGKGTLALFEPGMDEAAMERLSLHTDLADGITRGELDVFYQPIVDLTTGKVRGAEALVRWQHPKLGLLGPGHFITLAEDTGLIVPLGRWVLNEACRQAAVWPEDIDISVNLSARQLEDPALLEDVAHVLDVSGIRPDRLVLEVTESLIVRNMDAMVECLTDLRTLGVRVAIDDFGTGYSSLSSLMRLPLDVLKIDGSFVAAMLDRHDASALVQVVVDMGRTLGLEVVAEGIEQPEQADRLRQHGCHLGQGYLYSRPLPAEQFQSDEWSSASG